MNDFFYNGVWRMDWGLGGPNITAALIATLMVAVWLLAYSWRWGFGFALILFTLLGGCLVHTFSRGGMVALFVGIAPLIAIAPRPWPMKKVMAVALAVWVMIGVAFHLDAHERYAQGVVHQDLSIENRLHLWSHGPLMIADAPMGWGMGNAAHSYNLWYQPIGDKESYRTFVNSHLEWLVEFGWPMRLLYLFGWGAVLLLCFPSRKSRWLAVPLGIWLGFGVASFFSSVAESCWLWVVPCAFLVAVVVYRATRSDWPRRIMWMIPGGAAAMICAGLLIAGGRGTQIHGSRDRVIIGEGEPSLWLVVDDRVLGGDRFAKSLRSYLSEHPSRETIGIVWSLTTLPSDISGRTLVITGTHQGLTSASVQRTIKSASSLVLISPGYYPQEAGVANGIGIPVRSFFGEFSQSPVLTTWEDTGTVRRIAGAADFFPDWPRLILGKNDRS